MSLTARHFLFLQGVASPFFSSLAQSLREEGHRVCRVQFCAGDLVYWPRQPFLLFRGPLSDWPGTFRQLLERERITDVVLFGDRRAIHEEVIAVARNAEARVYVFEEGYARPNWLTLERNGVNGRSRLPREPNWFLRVNKSLPDYGDGLPVPTSLAVRAIEDLLFHGANVLNPLAFPRYETHRPVPPWREYLGWARRFAGFPWVSRHDAQSIRQLLESRRPYFVFPLQLNGDAQVVHYSPFSDMPEALHTVVNSFAKHAPVGTRLVIKNHPLDTGLRDYRGQLRDLTTAMGLADRVIYLETGDLGALLADASGVVTVNSTVGMTALGMGRPVKALGQAIYDLPGLCFQAELDGFWGLATPPDPALFEAFRNVVIHTTQVNGDFYTREGIRMAVTGCRRLLAPRSPLDELLA